MNTNLRLSALAVVLLFQSAAADAQSTLKVVMGGDLKILDPVWATNYLTRNHGYMVYDTLLAQDEAGNLKPQMLESFTESADKLSYSFTLRPGLLWHDGKPVTAEDCVASIGRWGKKDPVGIKLLGFVDAIKVADERTFTITLKEKTGLLLFALGKSAPGVAFMMPKRVADTDPNTQISDFTGSGPFVFKYDEWRPGDKAVYVRFDKYKPRPEPASGLAGGKTAKLDRVEWLAITDQQQAINGLETGQIDYVLQPSHDLLPLLKANAQVKLVDWNPLGNYYVFKPNWLHKPFDNEQVRQALWYVFNQKDFLDAQIGDPAYFKICKPLFPCNSALTTQAGFEDGKMESDFVKARELLKQGGYDGTPIVLMQSTDVANMVNLAPVAKSLMEKAGFKVEVQAMDWQTLIARRAKKDAPSAGGWHGFFTSWAAGDVQEPISQIFLATTCDQALYGWPCDTEMENLRDQFAREPDLAKQKVLGEQIQLRNLKISAMINTGQWYQPAAVRAGVTGVVKATVPVFWNIEKR